MQGPPRDSPSYHRNIGPITQMLKQLPLPQEGTVLEVGSGSGQHTATLALEFPQLVFQPSEYDEESFPSIAHWAEAGNILPAIRLDVTKLPWKLPEDRYEIVLCFNVVHISPWLVSKSLFHGAGERLSEKGRMLLYGPFKRDGEHTSSSNVEFDAWLKAQNPEFGIREIGDLNDLAKMHGLCLNEAHPMPANNFILEFGRS